LLQRPQPAAKTVRKRVRCETALEPGQHVIYQLDSGAGILLPVLSIHEDKGDRAPRVVVLDWQSDELSRRGLGFAGNMGRCSAGPTGAIRRR
jgi:hypothetical protein